MQPTMIKVVVDKNQVRGLGGIPSFQFMLMHDGAPLSLDEFMKMKQRTCLCRIEMEGTKFLTKCVRGDNAIWLPTGDGWGIKLIIRPDDTVISNLQYLRDCQSVIFPRIGEIVWATINDCKLSRRCVAVRMEDVSHTQQSHNRISLLIHRLQHIVGRKLKLWKLLYCRSDIEDELPGVHALLQCPTAVAERCAWEFARWRLFPEDEWYKPTNLIGGKIVDCHTFEFFPERYAFPVGKACLSVLQELYRSAPRAARTRTLYQGFKFANGYSFPGYSSDGKEFDTYRKLPFLPFRKVKNGIVLDLGSREGFFSFQAAIHGAREVIAIERNAKSVAFARELNRVCFGFSQITFIEGDVVHYVMSRDSIEVDVVFLLSVLHQIYPNMNGADAFLEKLASADDTKCG